MEPVVNIVGEQVALGPQEREMLPLFHRWHNDWATRRTLDDPPQPWTLDAEGPWNASLQQPENAVFTIYERIAPDGTAFRPIGETGVYGIDFRHRTAGFGILIGEADARGKGYGTEAARLMLDYAFTALSLHTILLDVASFNPAAIRAYEKAGFREIGRRRECWLLNGILHDKVYMECLAERPPSPDSPPPCESGEIA
ncbi:MAG: GNAT family N-acetyltransferase [Thermomicrobiales bacterium]